MTRLAIALSLVIAGLGLIGIASPDTMAQIGRPFESVYSATDIRVIFGGALVLAAPTSRAPRTLRIFGLMYLVAGLITPFLGFEFGFALHDWSVAQGPAFIRIWAGLALAFGAGFMFLLWPRSSTA